MKLTAVLVAALASLATATPLTFEQKCEKYKCLTLDTVENWNPPCATACFHEHLGGSKDGCAPDDFRCHCKRAGSIAPVSQAPRPLASRCLLRRRVTDGEDAQIMRGCLTSNATGCSPRDLSAIGSGLNEMCGYFNQTGYEAYKDCTKLLYSFVQFADRH